MAVDRLGWLLRVAVSSLQDVFLDGEETRLDEVDCVLPFSLRGYNALTPSHLRDSSAIPHPAVSRLWGAGAMARQQPPVIGMRMRTFRSRAWLVSSLALCQCGEVDDNDLVQLDSDTEDADPMPAAALPACASAAMTYFTADFIDPPSSSSNDYQVPSQLQLDDIRESLSLFWSDDLLAAEEKAEAAQYTLCQGELDDHLLAIWHPQTAGTGHASWAIRTGADVGRLIVEVPHGFYDMNTLLESTEVFSRVEARALITTGTNRCATPTRSGCDGTTLVCGRTYYVVSDMAHTTTSFFQVAHEALSDHFVEDWVLSLHGFSNDGFHISDGTTVDMPAGTTNTPTALLIEALLLQFPETTVASCNGYEGATPLSWLTTCMGGSSNVQARYTNQSDDPCTERSTITTSRFIHMEQNGSIRETAESRAKVADALLAVTPRAL